MRLISYSFTHEIPDKWKAIIRLACDAWEKSGKVKFRQGDSLNERIIFAKAGLPSGEVAHRAPAVNGAPHIIAINQNLTFSTATTWLGRLLAWSGDYDLLSVLEHEIGHVLCGAGHSSDFRSIMQDGGYLNLPSKPSKADFARITP